MWFFLILVAILLIALFISEYVKKQKYKNGTMSDEERARYERQLYNQQQQAMTKQIKSVMIVGGGSDSRKKVGSTVARGAVGGALLGPVGMIGGAMSGKNKTTIKTTFLIEYADGHRETKTVDSDSPEYEKLCRYIDMN